MLYVMSPAAWGWGQAHGVRQAGEKQQGHAADCPACAGAYMFMGPRQTCRSRCAADAQMTYVMFLPPGIGAIRQAPAHHCLLNLHSLKQQTQHLRVCLLDMSSLICSSP